MIPEIDEEELTPDDEDIFISDTGPLGSITMAYYCHQEIARGINRGDVEIDVKNWMDENAYWPNVWFISDHGNVHLITNLGE